MRTEPPVTPDTVLEHGIKDHGWGTPPFRFEDEDRKYAFEIHERFHRDGGPQPHTHEGTPA